jgi:hypothetical protein
MFEDNQTSNLLNEESVVEAILGTAAKIGNFALDKFTSSKGFDDLNKKAKENSLTLYALVSSNVPADYYKLISGGLEAKIATLIEVIAKNEISKDVASAKEFIQKSLTNTTMDSLINLGKTQANKALGLSEAVQTTPRKKVSVDMNSPIVNRKIDVKTSELAGRDKPFISPGRLFTFDIRATNARGDVVSLTYSIFVKVNLIVIDSDMLLTAMADAKESSTLYQYIKHRASGGGFGSFFKDVILNIKTLERKVARSTSNSLEDRILNDLIRNKGLIAPNTTMVSDYLPELKKFMVVIDKSDADRLGSEFNSTLTSGSNLKAFFSNMNMLSLCVIDTARDKATMFDSDKPTEMMVVSLRDVSQDKKIAEVFSKIYSR